VLYEHHNSILAYSLEKSEFCCTACKPADTQKIFRLDKLQPTIFWPTPLAAEQVYAEDTQLWNLQMVPLKLEMDGLQQYWGGLLLHSKQFL